MTWRNIKSSLMSSVEIRKSKIQSHVCFLKRTWSASTSGWTSDRKTKLFFIHSRDCIYSSDLLELRCPKVQGKMRSCSFPGKSSFSKAAVWPQVCGFCQVALLGCHFTQWPNQEGQELSGSSSARLFSPHSCIFVSLNSIILQALMILNYTTHNIQNGSCVLGITCL